MNQYRIIYTTPKALRAKISVGEPFSKEEFASWCEERKCIGSVLVHAETAADAITIVRINEGFDKEDALVLRISAVEQPGSSPSS
jgi:hypothetical protein